MFESFQDTPIVPPPTYAEPAAGVMNSTSPMAVEQKARRLNNDRFEESILDRCSAGGGLLKVLSIAE